MNITNLEHAGYSLVLLLGTYLATRNLTAGVLFGIAFFLGREHAQAQRNYNLGDLEALAFWKWSLDAQLDLLFPVVACIGVGLIIKFMTEKTLISKKHGRDSAGPKETHNQQG